MTHGVYNEKKKIKKAKASQRVNIFDEMGSDPQNC